MKRETAINAYGRTRAWAERETARLRAAILVPYFGGYTTRAHNCILNFEAGRDEGSFNGLSHRDLAKLAKRYEHQQREIWNTATRLGDVFARHF